MKKRFLLTFFSIFIIGSALLAWALGLVEELCGAGCESGVFGLCVWAVAGAHDGQRGGLRARVAVGW